MRLRHKLVTPLMIVTLLAAGACAGHRVYDPYYGDYHRWNGSEDGLYRQWEGETRRTHIDFGRRTTDEQRGYFDWRHRH